MKPMTIKILAIVIAAAIVAPAAYFAYEYYSKSNVPTSEQPFQYIPGNSTMISTVNNNGTEYYIYVDGGSVGIVANISSISQVDSNLTAANSPAAVPGTGNAKLFSGSNVKTITYDRVTVYELQNVNITSLLGHLFNVSGSNIANTTVNIFAYDTSGNFIVIGEQKAINESISAHLTSQNAVKFKEYVNQSSNISLYYRVNSTIPGISYITLNSTANDTHMNITPVNSNELSFDKSFIEKLISNPQISGEIGNNYTITISNGQIHLAIDMGYKNIPAIVKTLNIGVI